MTRYAPDIIFFWIIFAIAGYLTYSVLSPYLVTLFLSGMCAIVTTPLHRTLMTRLGKRNTLAALGTTFAVGVFLLLPLLGMASILVRELRALYATSLADHASIELLTRYLVLIEQTIRIYIPDFTMQVRLTDYAAGAMSWVIANVNLLFSNIILLIIHTVLFLAGVYFFSREGHRIRTLAFAWSPLSAHDDEHLFARMTIAINAVLKGALLSAFLQSVLVSIAGVLCGIPNPVLFGVIAFFAAFIPPFGSAFVTAPLGVITIMLGHFGAGVGLLVSGGVIGVIDNVIRPLIVKRGTQIHPFIILLSIMGGIARFGLLGFIVGPIIIAALFTLLEIFPSIMRTEGGTHHE
jgi:predicted PurR-regulated permease PerM